MTEAILTAAMDLTLECTAIAAMVKEMNLMNIKAEKKQIITAQKAVWTIIKPTMATGTKAALTTKTI